MLCTPEGIYLRNFYVGISIMGKEMGQGRGEHFVDCLKIDGGMGNLCSSECFLFCFLMKMVSCSVTRSAVIVNVESKVTKKLVGSLIGKQS